MNTTDLLYSLEAIGVRVELLETGNLRIYAPRGSVTTEMRELLIVHKSEIVELLRKCQVDKSELDWRIEAMRHQLPEPGKPFSLLCARSEISPKLGECFSCGETLKTSETGYACAACKRAKQFLLYEECEVKNA